MTKPESQRLTLTYAGGGYDRTSSLIEGDVTPDGINFRYLKLRSSETFLRMLASEEFDASEFSCANYFTLLSQDDRRFVAIPVFPSRSFRHGAIYINPSAGVRTPTDLRGKRVGIPDYAMTTGVWVRGILQDDYGVTPDEIVWVEGGIEQPGRRHRLRVTLPPQIQLQRAPRNRPLLELLEAGDIGALISPTVPRPLQEGSRTLARLFPDFAKAEEDYYRRTRIFPIMHTVVLRREVLERHPWVAASLFRAFSEAKERAIAALHDSDALAVSLAWLIHYSEEEGQLGAANDMWAYGLEPNRHVLETLKRYMAEQGLLGRDLSLDEAFAD
jgi:4,5-dihydroxyphthalate decarboxylase